MKAGAQNWVGRLAVVVALIAGGQVATVPVPARAEPPVPSSVIASITNSFERDSSLVTYSTRAGGFEFPGTPTLTDGIEVRWEAPKQHHIDIQVLPRQGVPLAPGSYTDLGADARRDYPVELRVGTDTVRGQVEILDLDATPDGRITRFHIVFRTGLNTSQPVMFGELRWNVPEQSAQLSPSAANLLFPRSAVNARRILATETFTNTSKSTIRIGQAKVVQASRDYTIHADHCSRQELPAGEACTLTVAFSPRAGGPRNALLTIPDGGQPAMVALDGTALQGVSGLSVSAGYPLGSTRQTSYAGLEDQSLSHDLGSPASGFRWYAPTTGTALELNLGHRNGPVTPGRHITHEDGDQNQYLFSLRVETACTNQYGVINVHRIKEDADHHPEYLNLSFRQHCQIFNRPEIIFTGRMRWQDRKDRTPPSRPAHLRIVNGWARWSKSTSNDWASTSVRVVPNSGSNATPTSGWAVSTGRSRTAKLPRLIPGHTYTLVAFSIDKAGNTSRPRKMAFTI